MAIRPPKNDIKISPKKETPAKEELETISNFYITSMLKKTNLNDPIMCVFTTGSKEISFEADGTNKIKVRLHSTSASGYPETESFTFKQIEKMFKDYINKKKKAGN